MEHQNLAAKLHKLTRLMTALSEHRWASDGYTAIKMGHLQALIKLAEADFNNNQLAACADMTKQSMNRLTNELLQLGYIVSAEEQSTDARIKILTLSDKGKKFITYLNTISYELEKKLGHVLGINKFDEFNGTLDNLLDFVEGRFKNI
ncbi:MarR family winged helix-turn-helix transcriptional regulator [Mucilaginibacter glaciei]|uniref:Winged helix-turn-helix transcriptional regulator n=1 Tax=Mucilaginibacter glaciei TaxID=2772109 RepID=A0A926NX30_9SPHI|nr:MarR family winged helix-turn-helix transcriptional regulator [Mucilaginibacter glaciei]MBD1393418.1 winged helix-turn-helix transcriptional regulator [Mucilaginibacter glaciei]